MAKVARKGENGKTQRANLEGEGEKLLSINCTERLEDLVKELLGKAKEVGRGATQKIRGLNEPHNHRELLGGKGGGRCLSTISSRKEGEKKDRGRRRNCIARYSRGGDVKRISRGPEMSFVDDRYLSAGGGPGKAGSPGQCSKGARKHQSEGRKLKIHVNNEGGIGM